MSIKTTTPLDYAKIAIGIVLTMALGIFSYTFSTSMSKLDTIVEKVNRNTGRIDYLEKECEKNNNYLEIQDNKLDNHTERLIVIESRVFTKRRK